MGEPLPCLLAIALVAAGVSTAAQAGDAPPQPVSPFHWMVGPELDVAFQPLGATCGVSGGFAAANFIALAHLAIGFRHPPVDRARTGGSGRPALARALFAVRARWHRGRRG